MARPKNATLFLRPEKATARSRQLTGGHDEYEGRTCFASDGCEGRLRSILQAQDAQLRRPSSSSFVAEESPRDQGFSSGLIRLAWDGLAFFTRRFPVP